MKNLRKLVLILAVLGQWVQGCGNNQRATMAPQTQINYLQQVRNGVIFSEGFENDDFLTAEDWVTLQGSPANTSNVFKQGIKSWDNTALTPGTSVQSIPVAQKSISYVPFNEGELLSVWFYDDTTHTTENGPYLKVKFSNGQFASIGVRNGVSTTDYSFATASPTTDDPTSAYGGAPRSTGWHLFQILITDATHYEILIDGHSPGNFPVAVGYITQIFLQADKVGGSGNSFGNFDELNLFKSQEITFKVDPTTTKGSFPSFDAGQLFYIYDQNWNFITKSVFPVDFNIETVTFFPLQDYPLSVYVQVADLITGNMIYTSPLLQVNPGDIWQFNQVELGRRCEMIVPDPTGLLNRNQTNSGQQEVLNYAFKDKAQFSIKKLGSNDPQGRTGLKFKQMADNWYRYAITGSPYMFMLDDVNEFGFGVSSGDYLAGTNKMTIMPNCQGNPTDGFSIGAFVILRNPDNTKKQILSVQAKSASILYFNENLNFDAEQYFYVHSQFLFPFMELGENNMGGFKLSDARYLYYDWQQNMQEYNS